MAEATLVTIPGPGAKKINIPHGSYTVQNLIDDEGLSNRDIIINGQAVMPQQYSSVTIPENSEVFATASVKGN